MGQEEELVRYRCGRESSGHMGGVGTWQDMSGQWMEQMEIVWHLVGTGWLGRRSASRGTRVAGEERKV